MSEKNKAMIHAALAIANIAAAFVVFVLAVLTLAGWFHPSPWFVSVAALFGWSNSLRDGAQWRIKQGEAAANRIEKS